MVTPLTKRKLDGTLYTRDAAVEAKLIELEALAQDEIIRRCDVRRRDDPEYVPGECLMYLVRARRSDNSDRYFGRLYRILIERLMRRLPASKSRDGRTESLTREKVRDSVLGRVAELLVADRASPLDKLDYFEVRFDGALASLRRDAQEKAWREENRTQSIEFNEETGGPSPEVERASGSFNPFNSSDSDDADYRTRLDAAIDALPIEQIRIIEMLRLGVPIDSEDPYAVTIAKTLRKSERTIRLHRDKAFAALRALTKRSEEL